MLWQDSQRFVVETCVAFLPLLCTLSWQLTQLLVIPLWEKLAGVHAIVEWQVSQVWLVGM